MPVITRSAAYPEGIIEKLRDTGVRICSIDALGIAKECGNIKAVNVVLIGVLAKTAAIDKEIWLKSIEEVVPRKFLDVNIKAFNAGYEHGGARQ